MLGIPVVEGQVGPQSETVERSDLSLEFESPKAFANHKQSNNSAVFIMMMDNDPHERADSRINFWHLDLDCVKVRSTEVTATWEAAVSFVQSTYMSRSQHRWIKPLQPLRLVASSAAGYVNYWGTAQSSLFWDDGHNQCSQRSPTLTLLVSLSSTGIPCHLLSHRNQSWPRWFLSLMKMMVLSLPLRTNSFSATCGMEIGYIVKTSNPHLG